MAAIVDTRSYPLVRVGSVVGFLLSWQVIAWWVNDTLLPPPTTVLSSLWQHVLTLELPFHLSVTLSRVAASFVLAMLIGTAIGIAMGRSHRIDSALDSLLVLALNVPALVTIILCYVWFGLTEVAAVTAVAINKIPTVVVTVREGARAIDKQLLEVAQVFRVSRRDTLFKVYLPQMYPYLMASARSGLALIWKIVLVVELLGRSNGIGFQLGTFFQFFDINGILGYTLAFAAVILVLEGTIMRPMERRLTRWRT